MSIYAPKTPRGRISGEFALAAGVLITAEGQALVRNNAAQAAGVLLSTGAASDIFVGFAIAHTAAAPFAEPFYNAVETYVVASNGQIVLNNAPVAGQVGLFDVTAGSKVTIDGTTVKVVGQVVQGLTAGDTVSVTYKYALSVLQRNSLFGNEQPGGYVGNIVGQIGYISKGPVYTSEFDASVDWSTATGVKLAANGQVTNQAGAGQAIQGATIISLPSTQIPYLGLNLG